MVTRWSGEALAELKSLERGSTAVVARAIRQRAQQIAAEAGREQVERADLGEALIRYYRSRRRTRRPRKKRPPTEIAGSSTNVANSAIRPGTAVGCDEELPDHAHFSGIGPSPRLTSCRSGAGSFNGSELLGYVRAARPVQSARI